MRTLLSVSTRGLALAIGALLGSTFVAAAPTTHAAGEHYGAAMNYRLHCEGCHKEDGSGQPGYIPALRGNVARLASTSEGREYVARVPGTVQSLLTDQERADVLNWIVRTFDPQHLPADFAPYTATEMAHWRFDPLSQPSVVRARLVAMLDRGGSSAVVDSTPAVASAQSAATGATPDAFAVCAACHTVTPDGAPGIGPNLHGVMGRKAGAAPGFSYSPAMMSAGFQWSRESLDEYLTSPAAKVPGNYMMYAGQPDPAERKAIIDYLESLR